MSRSTGILALLMAFGLAACATGLAPEDADLVLKPAQFSDLPGWGDDNLTPAAQAFAASCTKILSQPNPQTPFGPSNTAGTYGQWQAACRLMTPETSADPALAKFFFEQNFRPWRGVAESGQSEGLFTGYYEASLNGSLTQHGPYQTPIRKRPDDLVMVDLGKFRPALKGQRIAGRVIDGSLEPYEDHKAIDDGKLPGDSALPLVWVDDPVKAFFLQIQGSGRIALDNGTVLRVGYAGQNGYPYYAIGRELVKRGALDKDNVSMQSIEGWLKTHPDQAQSVMETNPSYVFFKTLDGEGPLGAEGVALTGGRSLAVDSTKVPYGAPVWLSVNHRLMIAQDTGGAIRGPVRGDIFFGYGPEAEAQAGVMKAPGEWWILLPRSIENP